MPIPIFIRQVLPQSLNSLTIVVQSILVETSSFPGLDAEVGLRDCDQSLEQHRVIKGTLKILSKNGCTLFS